MHNGRGSERLGAAEPLCLKGIPVRDSVHRNPQTLVGWGLSFMLLLSIHVFLLQRFPQFTFNHCIQKNNERHKLRSGVALEGSSKMKHCVSLNVWGLPFSLLSFTVFFCFIQ